MLSPVASFKRHSAGLLLALVVVLCLLVDFSTAATKIRDGADPSIIKVGDNYFSVESAGGGIWVRKATSLLGLGADGVERKKVWSDSTNLGEVWAPEISMDSGKTWIHFAAGTGPAHRMYAISSDTPDGTYSSHTKVNLPDDRWAIDGTLFIFEGQRWFVWSGWSGETSGGMQNLYICKMSSPTQSTGGRFIISQPKETWEQGDSPLINEGPEAIIDPNGQLHIVYSANGSWGSKYCLADLRLKKGGNPTNVWDWYKSNGCLFGSHQDRMMSGWDATVQVDGPGHHTFVMPNGDIRNSQGGTSRIPFVFHAVKKGETYSWSNRDWFTGSWVWWSKTNYHRGGNTPGDHDNSGYSFKFFE
ncbi:uncharacterized protein E0L32_003431 [Thyridium curvatum]|uniref:Uncharacterized protein n=1 Tax=Thyridium curvatum TaxID=1093900 RepID=A0A507BHN6_9PEZI|nr:uncharacterized protein E0L32_003431 [Thyridium curvatum]TPX16869.1 hypothetical protein E0L32_003431 [Thyridium curvatum]